MVCSALCRESRRPQCLLEGCVHARIPDGLIGHMIIVLERHIHISQPSHVPMRLESHPALDAYSMRHETGFGRPVCASGEENMLKNEARCWASVPPLCFSDRTHQPWAQLDVPPMGLTEIQKNQSFLQGKLRMCSTNGSPQGNLASQLSASTGVSIQPMNPPGQTISRLDCVQCASSKDVLVQGVSSPA